MNPLYFIPYTWDDRVFAAIAGAAVVGAAWIGVRVRPATRRNRALIRCIGAFAAMFIAYSFYILQRQSVEKATDVECERNLKALGLAILGYEEKSGDRLPSATSWVDACRRYLPNGDADSVLHGPAARTAYSYAFNAAMSGKPLESIANPASTIMLFECDTDREGAIGGAADAARSRRNWESGYYCVMCDGSVQRVTPWNESQFSWKP